MIKGKKIFITGGAGYLGKNLVKRYYKDNEITIYSRDEAKHYYLKKEFPNVKWWQDNSSAKILKLNGRKNNGLTVSRNKFKEQRIPPVNRLKLLKHRCMYYLKINYCH